MAIVYRDTLTATEVIKDIPDYDDPQRRVIAASFGELRVVCAYFVNGEAVDSDKYAYKLTWLGKLERYLADSLARWPQLALLGISTSPRMTATCTTRPAGRQGAVLRAERAAFQRLVAMGLATATGIFMPTAASTAGGITARRCSAATWACASTISCCRRRCWRAQSCEIDRARAKRTTIGPHASGGHPGLRRLGPCGRRVTPSSLSTLQI